MRPILILAWLGNFGVQIEDEVSRSFHMMLKILEAVGNVLLITTTEGFGIVEIGIWWSFLLVLHNG
jgi:hypothetical protein